MHLVVYDQLGASAYTSMLLYAWKKPGYAIHRTKRRVCKYDRGMSQLWIGDMSHRWVYHFYFY
jgi:hypothetical protein